ncbi:hypothetical protein Btru_051034 [Bulinus truncatus]|nr:hypothetical protein Btru_051034 [Bulinus truncatus]
MATQVLDYRIFVDEKNFKAESFFPGLAYIEFDRTGGLGLWNISRIFEAGRAVPFFQANFLDYTTLRSEKNTFFVLGGDYYFDTCLWDVARKFHYFPYKVSIELINTGPSSITIREVLTNLLDGKEIATFYGKMVYVDRVARKSQPLPEWFRKKYETAVSSSNIRIESSNPLVPSNSYKVKVLITPSDTDFNGHTNQGSYVRFCMDAAETARQSQFLKCFTSDICQYPILKLTVSYKLETLAGDEVITSVWQEVYGMATQVFDYRVVVDEKRLRAETFFPGIAYVEFNRTGCLSVWNICKMFEAGRIIPFFEANFLDNKTLRSDESTFFSAWRQALTNMLDGKEIATFYGKYVYVDKTSKKSQSFPGWYRIKYGSVESSHNIQFESSNSLVPENVFKAEFVIAPSDTDFNGHTNQGSYVRFCLDAAEIVRQAQNLKDFTTDVCLYPVVKLSTSYKGETSAGDKVSMSVWQDHKAPSVLNFALHKGDKLAFTACLTFKTPFNCRL